jgi:hypothetical protein
MSLSVITTPFFSNRYPSGLSRTVETTGIAGLNNPFLNPMAQQTADLTGLSDLTGGSSLGNGDLSSALSQAISMVLLLLESLFGQSQGGESHQLAGSNNIIGQPTVQIPFPSGSHNALHILPGFDVTEKELQEVKSSYNKIPVGLRYAAEANGAGIDLITGGAGNHPDLVYLKNQSTFDGGRTFADLPGVGGGPTLNNKHTVISVDLIGAGRDGSEDVVLHEHAHSIDAYLNNLSSQSDWMAIFDQHKNDPTFFTSYERSRSEEAFAESFANYYNSPQTRATLPADVQQYFANLEKKYP